MFRTFQQRIRAKDIPACWLNSLFVQRTIVTVANPAPTDASATDFQPIAKNIQDPLRYPDYFGVRKLFTMKELFNARVHLGHKEGTLDPNMRPFLFGSCLGHLIIDLDQTVLYLQAALNFTAHIAYRGGIILLVCHNPQHTLKIEEAAKSVSEYAHCREWKRTILTNSEKVYRGVTRLPDLCILLSTLDPLMQEHTCVRDAAKMNIPTIGIVDTNSNPELITYPVPGNDDSPQSIELYCKLFSQAIQLGKSKRSASLQMS